MIRGVNEYKVSGQLRANEVGQRGFILLVIVISSFNLQHLIILRKPGHTSFSLSVMQLSLEYFVLNCWGNGLFQNDEETFISIWEHSDLLLNMIMQDFGHMFTKHQYQNRRRKMILFIAIKNAIIYISMF